MVLDAHSNPLAATYPKRAKQIVKQGRAEWVNESAIRMLVNSPDEMRAKTMPDEINARNEQIELEQENEFGDRKALVSDLEVGDVICLNSGGPGMTIMEIHDGQALCR